MLGENVVNLIQEVRKLREFSKEMEMATRYKKWNYGYLDRLIIKTIEEGASEDEFKTLYPR